MKGRDGAHLLPARPLKFEEDALCAKVNSLAPDKWSGQLWSAPFYSGTNNVGRLSSLTVPQGHKDDRATQRGGGGEVEEWGSVYV